VRAFPILITNIFQRALICVVKRVRQFIESAPYTVWQATTKVGELTENPTEHAIGSLREGINYEIFVRCFQRRIFGSV